MEFQQFIDGKHWSSRHIILKHFRPSSSKCPFFIAPALYPVIQ